MRALRHHYSLVTSRWLVGVCVLAIAGPLHAQVVRGVVRDSRTQAPIPGVIVALDEAGETGVIADSLQRSSLVLAVLTNERGEYSVQAGRRGRWVVSAKRVGLRRYVSPPFQMNVGENLRRDITLEPIDFTASLPTIAVTTDAPCSVNQHERDRVAAMWEEARAALTAAQLSLRDRLFRATVVRYQRELSPTGLRVLKHEQAMRRGVTERAFVSVAPDRLSSLGYVQAGAEGDLIFNAPDAEVLTSTAFVRDHCFSVRRPDRERAGLIGLAFQPVSSRRVPGIQGALWLDSTNYALRLVEFRYTKLPPPLQPEHARGEVQFGHLPNGAWYVSRWFIRMPEYKAAQVSARVVVGGSPTLNLYREEGGDVTIDGMLSEVRAAKLTGMATDSVGRPLRDAVVRLAGTQYSARVGTDGNFRFDSLAAGAYTLRLEHADYAALGLLAAEQELEVAEGRAAVTAVRALTSEQVLRRLCGVSTFDGDVAAVRVSVRGAAPTLPGLEVRARWSLFERPTGGAGPASIRPITEKATTDTAGTVMFCKVPARQQIRFEFTPVGENHVIHQVYTAPHHSISTVILRP